MSPPDETKISDSVPDVVENLDRAWSEDPEGSFAALVKRGAERLRAGQLEEAAEPLQQAEARSPDDHQVQSLLGLLAYRQRHFAEATRRFAALLLRFPDEPSLLLNLALAQLGSGRLEATRDSLQHLLALRPDHARAASVLKLVQEQLADLPTAAQAFQQSGNYAAAAQLLRRHVDHVEQQTQETEGGAQPTLTPDLSNNVKPKAITSLSPPSDEHRSRPQPVDLGAHTSPPAEPTPTQNGDPATPVAPDSPPPTPRTKRSDSVVDLQRVEPFLSSAPVTMRDGLVAVRIDEMALLRQDRWLGRTGVLEISTAPSRQRGQLTGEAMGGSRPLVAVTGQGSALLRIDEPMAVTTEVHGELFVIEERLLALTGNCRHESAHLPLPDGSKLSLLRLRGEGIAVLVADRRPARLQVDMQSAVVVRASAMVAFVGKILPRVDDSTSLAGSQPMLHLLGKGEAWVDGGSILD